MTDGTPAPPHRGNPLALVQGLAGTTRATIVADVIAGATLAAVAIPESMGYTKIAGMPVITGIYTLAVPAIVFALLGSSRHLVVGADSATAAIMFAALVTMAGVALGCYSFGPRMLHFGWLCLIVLLLVLGRFQQTGRGLWVLPPLFGLWINVHGSWVFGFVVMGIYVVSGLVQGQWNNVAAERWTPVQLRKLLLIFAASVGALFANPYGYKLVWYPFDLLFRQKVYLDSMGEWQSVNFHTGWGKLALFMIFALLGTAWFSRKPWKLCDILLATFAVWASLNHLRFLLFAAIILVPILAPRLRLFPPYDAEKDKPWLNLAITAAVVAIIVGSYPSAAQLQNNIDSQFPRDALRFIQQRQITGRLFNWYDFGGYIEFYAPAIKTFADGRTDIFAYNGVLNDYIKINAIESSFELLDKYKIDYVLFPVDTRLTYVLAHSPGWHTIYEDKVARLFERVPAAAPLKTQLN